MGVLKRHILKTVKIELKVKNYKRERRIIWKHKTNKIEKEGDVYEVIQRTSFYLWKVLIE